MRPLSILISIILAAVAFGAERETNAGATSPATAVWLVSNLNDAGPGSLRQAIADANANSPTADSIEFEAGLSGTIHLTSGEMLVSDSLTINGPGAGVLTIAGGGATRLFQLAANRTVVLNGLTLTGGNGAWLTNNGFGGAIFSSANATISNCVITGNFADNAGGAIVNLGTMTISDSTISNNSSLNGGAIYGQGPLTLADSTVSGNTASSIGGAIYQQQGSATIANSTISGNLASGTSFAGAIALFANSAPQTLLLSNSTLANNTAGTPGAVAGLVLAAQGSGVSSIATVRSTIFANNAGPNLGTQSAISGVAAITSQGYNLASDGGSGFLTAVGDQLYTDPRLGPLRNNGGPTATHSLLSGSPAIDRGKSFGAANDQRGPGFLRLVDLAAVNAEGGDGADVGALELQSEPPPPTATISGRVLRPNGLPLANARVNLIDEDGSARVVTSSSFGVFSFPELATGRIFLITVISKRYRFAAQNVTLNGDVTGLDLLGLE